MTYVWRLCVCANDDEVKVLVCVCARAVTCACVRDDPLFLFVLLYVCVPSLKVCGGWLRRMSLVVRVCGEDALILILTLRPARVTDEVAEVRSGRRRAGLKARASVRCS